jgi:hypothetical protein
VEETAVVAPAAEVRVEGREVGETVDDVNAGEAELGAQEARVGLGRGLRGAPWPASSNLPIRSSRRLPYEPKRRFPLAMWKSLSDDRRLCS